MDDLIESRINARCGIVTYHKSNLTIEEVLTGEDYFGLTTATPMQRAVCRIADGLPIDDLLPNVMQPVEGYDDLVTSRSSLLYAVGGDQAELAQQAAIAALPRTPPLVFLLLSGIRTAKSLFAAAAAFTRTQTVDMSPASTGEEARVSVMSYETDKADEIYEHIARAIERSEAMRAVYVGSKPSERCHYFRNPCGRVVEIMIVAAKKYGGSTVSRWSASAIFEEAPRMQGSGEGKVNLPDQKKAVLGRLLPGAQIIETGSPFAPAGEVFREVKEFHGKPSSAIVVLRIPAPVLNPFWWTPEWTSEVKAADNDAYMTDAVGEFIDTESAMLGFALVASCLRVEGRQMPRDPRVHYRAYTDPATRSNAWTLVIGGLYPDGVRRVVVAVQWIPGETPLDSHKVIDEMKAYCDTYGVTYVTSDQFAADPLADTARSKGLNWVRKCSNATTNREEFDATKENMSNGLCEAPDVPSLAEDLKNVRRKTTRAGVSISLVRTDDGRHADYAPPLARLWGLYLEPPLDDIPKEVKAIDPRAGWADEEIADEDESLGEEDSESYFNQRDW